MEIIKSEDRWFATLVNDVWCRMGGNGPINVSQLMPLVKWTYDEESFLDVGWSRHVIDHLDGFEQPMNEHCRVARKRVVCILWYAMNEKEEHDIKPIFDNGKTYPDEYLNQYSRKKIELYLEGKKTEGWKLKEYHREVSWQGGKQGKGGDTILV